MSTLKEMAKRVTPPGIWNALGSRYWYWRREAEWYLSPKRWASVRRLRRFKNKHAGERCFILGNGPSLNKMDLSPLYTEYTFGLNRIYLMFPQLGFPTTYLVSVNPLVTEQCSEEISRLLLPKFLSWTSRKWVQFGPNMIFLRSCQSELDFSYDPTRCIHEGATVTYVAMQLAYYMGFQRVILIGVDHSFVTQGAPHKEVMSAGDDPNHFSPQYFGKGFRWQLPDLETSELAYRLARDAYQRDGREIVDATVGGKLDVFPKVAYDSLFAR